MHLLTLLKMNVFSSTTSNKTVKNTFTQQETCALRRVNVISAIQRLARKNRRVACCRIYLESLCKARSGTSGFLLQTCMMQFLQDFENGLSRGAETVYYATFVSGAAAYSQGAAAAYSQGITVTPALPSVDFNLSELRFQVFQCYRSSLSWVHTTTFPCVTPLFGLTDFVLFLLLKKKSCRKSSNITKPKQSILAGES